MYSFTNYKSLDELDSYVDKYDNTEGNELDSVIMAIKVMPSYNTEKNAIFMTKTNDVLYF